MILNSTFRRRVSRCLLASCALVPGAAFAQQAATPQVSAAEPQRGAVAPQDDVQDQSGDIIVTASKRSESVQNIPASVAVVSGETLTEFNLKTLSDLKRLDSGLQLTSNGVGDNNIIMRGIKSTGAATVALYFDEAVITGYNRENAVNGRAPDLGSYDIQRVELLKGPQGTLFGAGAMAGAIRIIPNKPNLRDVSGNLTGIYSDGTGTNALYELNGFLNVPLVNDKLGLRVVGWYSRGGGYIDNSSSGMQNVNDAEVRGVRGSLLFKPVDQLTITLTGLYQKIDVDGTQRYKIDAGGYNNSSPVLEPHFENAKLFSAVVDYDLGVGNIVATSSYYRRELHEYTDTTPTAKNVGLSGYYDVSRFQNRSIWSNELRFSSKFSGPIQLVTGAFYEQDKNFYEIDIMQTPFNGIPVCATVASCQANGLGDIAINGRDVTNPVNQWAVFGQVDWTIAPGLTATIGARYYKANIDNLERTLQRLRRPGTAIQTVPVVAVDNSDSQAKPSYNFALAYKPSPKLTIYARAASGFRIGGLNNSSVAAQFGVTIPTGYKPDSLWNYEIGIKGNAGPALSYELTGFHIDWSNLQVPAYSSSGAFTYIVNAGSSVVNGIEAQLRLRPVAGLSLTGGLSYTDSHLTADQPAASANSANRGLKGDNTPYIPRWSLVGQARYEGSIGGRWTGYVSTSMNYRSSVTTNFNKSMNFYYVAPSYLLADAVIGVKTVDGLDISLLINNLTNRKAQISIEVSADGFRAFTPRPRTFGLRVSKNF